jgi:predicted nucleic acid-binding protein
MIRSCLVDTCVLIDYFRGNPAAEVFLKGLVKPPFLSSLTVAELYAGVRDGKEHTLLDHLVQHTPVIPLNSEIAIKGGLYRRQYSKSHNVGIIDALLAASAEVKKLVLVTHNIKHFPMITNVYRPY